MEVNNSVAEAIKEEEAKKELLRKLYLEQVEDYCNVYFEDKIPAGVELALNELVKTDPSRFNVASEKLSDMSITYATGGTQGTGAGSIPAYILAWLEPYRRLFLLSKKGKKKYNGGCR